MLIKIAIADENQDYVKRFLSVMEGYEEVSLSVYTEKKALEQALATKQFDVLLFDPSVYEGQIATSKKMLAIMLLDEAKGVPETCKEFLKVQKYQRISRIYQQILELYSEVCGNTNEIVGKGKVTTIAFYSPVGGAGKTTLAMVAATKYAQQGYRTFYLNLEDIASDNCYLQQKAEKGLSEIVAHMGENVNFTMKMQSLLQSKLEGLFYLSHFVSPNDVYEMTKEEVTQLIEQIQRTGLFDVIVIDMSTVLDCKLQAVFEQVNKIVVIEKTDSISSTKMNCFYAQTHIMNEYSYKMVRVINYDMGKVAESAIPLIGRVSSIHNIDSAQLIVELANNSTTDFVMKLI